MLNRIKEQLSVTVSKEEKLEYFEENKKKQEI